MAHSLPTGTVTFLFTDIEGSTRLAQQYRGAWEELRARHHAIARPALEAHGGYVFEVIGDAFCVAFDRPIDALRGALEAQRKLHAEDWGPAPIRVRMGIHTGIADPAGSGYRGYLAMSSVQRVMSAAHGGQIILSQGAFDLVENDLPDDVVLRDMGEHRLKDLLRRQHLYQVVVADLPADFPPLRSLDLQPNNLPVQLTTFIGRDHEIAGIAALLERNRLVTLTGLAGTGKTRLALQVAAEVLEHFVDGAWFVELASLTDPALVPQAITSALKVHEQPGRDSIEVLKDHLGNRSLLLLLDNCEHLIEACAQAADAILHAAPRVRILATSREGLGVAGEAVYPILSLPVPDAAASTAQAISDFDAVRLFIDRAQSIQPAFRITDRNAPIVAQICTRLDGIPLALELAAARVRGMTLEQVASRLDDRFRLLTGGSRTAPTRQRTLQATIDWSHDLLTEAERALFRRLGVFSGGWTPEAAQAVTAAGVLDGADVLDLLSSLVEKSLLVLDMSTGRYNMLETVREYALERLRDSGEEAAFRARHLDWFAAWTEVHDLDTDRTDDDLAMVATEHENMLAALRWCDHDPGGGEKGLRIMGATRRYWVFRSLFQQGYHITERLLSLPGAAARTHARRRGLYTLASLGFFLGRLSEIRSPMEESLSIARELNDKRGLAESLHWLGTIVSEMGGLEEGIRMYEEALQLAQELGYTRLAAGVYNDMGEALRGVGDYERAEAMIERSLGLAPPSVAQPFRLLRLLNLAAIAIQRGDLERGRLRLREAFGAMPGMKLGGSYAGYCLEVGSGLMAAQKEWELAARLFGAAERQRALTHEARNRSDSQFIEPLVASTRAALGADAFEKAFEGGHGLEIDAALAELEAWLRAHA